MNTAQNKQAAPKSFTPTLDVILMMPTSTKEMETVERGLDRKKWGQVTHQVGLVLRSFSAFRQAWTWEQVVIPSEGLLGSIRQHAQDLIPLLYSLEDAYAALASQPSAETAENAANALAFVVAGHALLKASQRLVLG